MPLGKLPITFWLCCLSALTILTLCPGAKATEEPLPARLRALEQGGLIWPPYVQGELIADLFYDGTFKADDPGDETSDLFIEAKLNTLVFFSRDIFLESVVLFEPPIEPQPSEDRWLEDHGFLVGALALSYEKESFWVSGGKGTINFSLAKSLTPGIWGTDIAFDEVKVGGKVGLAGSYAIDAGNWGNHALYGSVFCTDTSALSRWYGTSLERVSKSMGGPGNTGSLSSFAVALDGGGFPALPGFTYHLAGIAQDVDRVNNDAGEPLPPSAIDDEYRFAIAAQFSDIALTDSLSLTPLVEYDRITNAGGNKDQNRDYLTASLGWYLGQWNLALAYTGWWISYGEGTDESNSQFQLSGGYLFNSGVGLDIGYRYLDEADTYSHTIGVALSYLLPFAF